MARKGAVNIHGVESEQSKVRRGLINRPDPLAGKGSISAKVKAARKRKKEILKALGVDK